MFAARNLFMTRVGLGQLTSNTYSQIGRYLADQYATWANMNDSNCNTGTATSNTNPSYVQTDLGSVRLVSHIIIGYDRNDVIPGGWGISYSVSGGAIGTGFLQTSSDGSSFTNLFSLPSYSQAGSPANGLAKVDVNTSTRYLRIVQTKYFALTEFQVWAY